MLVDLLRTDLVFRAIVIFTADAFVVAAFWVALVIFNGRSSGCG